MRKSVSLSIVIHLFFICLCLILAQNRAAQIPARQLTWIDLEPLKEPLSKVQDSQIQKQIVQTTKVQKTEKAAPDAFLGEQNQVVDRQTVSNQKTTTMGEDKTQSESERKQSVAKALEAAKHLAVPQVGPLSKFGLAIIPKAPSPKEVQNEQEKDAHNENWAAQQTELPQDYVKGVKESDRTLLNTKEFVFYGYFQRIRERLDRAWVPILREKMVAYYKGGRQLASDMDHTTKVLVVLNNEGAVTKVQVLSESGTEELDDAAVKAFNKAGPFPNPPRGIVDPSGLIQIPWEFVLKT